MACACKVNQQIDYLHKKYGDNIPKNKETHIAMTPLEFIMNLGTLLVVIIASPIMFVGLLIRLMIGKTNIKISDTFFGLKYARRTK